MLAALSLLASRARAIWDTGTVEAVVWLAHMLGLLLWPAVPVPTHGNEPPFS